MPDNEEVAWSAVNDTTVSTDKKTVPPKQLQRRPWLRGTVNLGQEEGGTYETSVG